MQQIPHLDAAVTFPAPQTLSHKATAASVLIIFKNRAPKQHLVFTPTLRVHFLANFSTEFSALPQEWLWENTAASLRNDVTKGRLLRCWSLIKTKPSSVTYRLSEPDNSMNNESRSESSDFFRGRFTARCCQLTVERRPCWRTRKTLVLINEQRVGVLIKSSVYYWLTQLDTAVMREPRASLTKASPRSHQGRRSSGSHSLSPEPEPDPQRPVYFLCSSLGRQAFLYQPTHI